MKLLVDDRTKCSAAAVGADVIRLLVHKYGIDLSTMRDGDGRTPMHTAVWRNGENENVLDGLIDVAGIDVDACEV